jgi:2-keto-4-pentenoate hydratase/2-oxohepta-3-ene-1,7-dioic acid hydratase in catechol pathway
MKIGHYSDGRTTKWGFIVADSVRAAGRGTRMLDALSDGEALDAAFASAGPPEELSSVTLLAPVPEPPQFIGVGLNYREHAIEAGFAIPTAPVTFPFHRSAIIGTGHAIEIPSLSQRIDWEAELAIVIGSGGRDLPVESALDHVAGYTIVNDVSARDVQEADGQWSRAKSFDTFKPMGPWITMVDELGDASNLEITLTVNGQIKQSGSTDDLVFSIAEIVSFISRGTTLLPGAVIATGTPAGVGLSRTPPEFLRHGDVVAIEVTGIGRLLNPVVDPAMRG